MKSCYVSDVEDEIAFAKKAAEAFAKNPKYMTFSVDGVKPGALLAIRWGMGDDCVVVVKLDENHIPTNYMNLVTQGTNHV